MYKIIGFLVTEKSKNVTTIYYKGYENPYIHYSVGGKWTAAPGIKMTPCTDVEGYNYKVEIDLDEATAMLDPKGRREISEVIAELRNENKELTILSITHDIDEASKSDEVIILNKGVLYKQGKPQDIFVDDSSLEDIRLDLPFTFRLHKALKEEGLNVQYENSVEEMVKKICQ